MDQTHSKAAEVDISNYPIVRIKAYLDSPTVNETKKFIDILISSIKSKKGPFVILIDATEAKWVRKEIRSIIGIGFQYLEKEYSSRYKMTFRCFGSWKTRVLHSLIVNFIKSDVNEQTFSDINDAEKVANNYITSSDFKSS